MNKKRLMVMACGTGGHIFPGLSVAYYLIDQGWEIYWLGTKDRLEHDLVSKKFINIKYINIKGIRGKSFKELIISPFYILHAFIQARKIIKLWRPNVVLGMGGYVSGPGGLAAWSYGIPLVLHEQNSVAGLTNKCLYKIATKVMQGFSGAFKNAEIVGNPIRPNICHIPLPKERFSKRVGPLRILVIGGSQGSSILNNILPKVAQKLQNKIIIWHQVGKGNLQNTINKYKKSCYIPYKICEFIKYIYQAYEWADLVISRSGAMTVSEISIVGLPAIFVPFEHKDRQQYWNALQLVNIGSAKIITQSNFNEDSIINIIKNYNRKILVDMAEKSRQIAKFNATERIAQELISIVKKNNI